MGLFFFAAGTEGLIRIEEKLNTPKILSLIKTQSRAFRTSDGQKVTLNVEWLLVPDGLV